MPPISLLVKPASGSCNMRCRYCFYTDETENRTVPSMGVMSIETMKTMVDKALIFADGDCSFAFQGGEPSLAGLPFFRALTDYVKDHPNPKKVRVHYSFQTNGYNLNEDWAKWFVENQVLVGISLDGPKEIHDRYRVDHAGKGTYQKVMSSIQLFNKYHVDYNILTVVTSATSRHGQQVYNFFKKNDFRYQQYIECLDPIGEVQGGYEYSLTPERYEEFLKTTFDSWYLDMKSGRYVYNRYFENLMMIIARQGAESCNMRGVCGAQWVIEADGSVYPCDFYALDEWYLGNINQDSFETMEQQRQTLGFIEWSKQIPEDCKNCRYFGLCRNGCRRNREPVTSTSTQKNYFCSAYKNFIEYAYSRLAEIYQMLVRRANQRP
ncbi:MAG: anaerobic sulfatase maturase [Lachnospiraceae bacterium]|nr:anaerobic sulfatase maturase [Lachnospiraceae bacterium]MBQ2400714.1 anaerobic sulfatase maturase [Lachnospiraceae bacterium]MBQ5660530.1 anaerobic sulfatase maturase [Lachnospiraceae bacterium]MBQ5699245.1 anaerobic sulfatase maturase [Lachnospiraceae bacterium]MBQ5806046.1 anaerobic sulfatase maturase [Lachnospiraceae bacterium]